MSLHRRDAKRDANEGEIVKALETIGATVFRLSDKDIPDLLVVYRGEAYFIEVKVAGEKLRPGQVEFFARLEPGAGGVAWIAEDALRIIGAIE